MKVKVTYSKNPNLAYPCAAHATIESGIPVTGIGKTYEDAKISLMQSVKNIYGTSTPPEPEEIEIAL